MTILVRLGEGAVEKWGIIELQGDLESRTKSSLLSKYIGDLFYGNQNDGIPILIVGHHILYGKSVKLDKPYAVMGKRKICSTDGDVSQNVETQYEIKALVTKKIIFKIRPKPIIISTSPSL